MLSFYIFHIKLKWWKLKDLDVIMKRIQIKKKEHEVFALLNCFTNKEEYRLWLTYEQDRLCIFDNQSYNTERICIIDQFGKLLYLNRNNHLKRLTYRQFEKFVQRGLVNSPKELMKRYEKLIKLFYEALTKYASRYKVAYDDEDFLC